MTLLLRSCDRCRKGAPIDSKGLFESRWVALPPLPLSDGERSFCARRSLSARPQLPIRYPVRGGASALEWYYARFTPRRSKVP